MTFCITIACPRLAPYCTSLEFPDRGPKGRRRLATATRPSGSLPSNPFGSSNSKRIDSFEIQYRFYFQVSKTENDVFRPLFRVIRRYYKTLKLVNEQKYYLAKVSKMQIIILKIESKIKQFCKS